VKILLKKLTVLLIVLSMFTLITACAGKRNIETTDKSKVQIVVTFNALREFAEAVGRDKVQVVTIVPDGTEPHDFEPKARDLEKLQTSKIFVYNGLGMEPWVQKVLEVTDNKNLNIVDSSKGFDLIKNSGEEIEEHGEYDPHVWLSLKGAQSQAKNIRDALITVDIQNKDYYEKNYVDFSSKLESLYSEYRDKFSTVANKNFVTGHAAFAYLCRDFGLKQNSVEDVFAEGEPTPMKLKELVDYSKENKIKTIFMEDMASPKVSETLAKEVGAKTERIHTLESKEDNKNYLESMRGNLEKIYNSLK
jgi:zinc transport system substrate-binding protein